MPATLAIRFIVTLNELAGKHQNRIKKIHEKRKVVQYIKACMQSFNKLMQCLSYFIVNIYYVNLFGYLRLIKYYAIENVLSAL